MGHNPSNHIPVTWLNILIKAVVLCRTARGVLPGRQRDSGSEVRFPSLLRPGNVPSTGTTADVWEKPMWPRGRSKRHKPTQAGLQAQTPLGIPCLANFMNLGHQYSWLQEPRPSRHTPGTPARGREGQQGQQGHRNCSWPLSQPSS